MKCLVLGGAGFIGSHVVDALIEAGHKVVVVDHLSTGKQANLNPKAKFFHDDIEDKDLWGKLGKHNYVYHLAAHARIQPSIKHTVKAHNTNVNGTLNVLEYCRRHGSKLIFSSSSSIYSGEKLPTRESSPKNPKNPYSLQKYICEQYIELYHKLYGLDYAILRYFNVYGDRQLLGGAYATILGIFLKQKAEGKPLTITGDGEQRRDFTHIADVARANLLAMKWQGAFNIGGGKNYSINELAELVGGPKKYIPGRIGEVRETLADNSKAKKFGWVPTPDALLKYHASLNG